MFALPALAADRYVSAGQSLQEALNAALPGDTITLESGATFTGNFVLPVKSATTDWITIQSSLIAELPSDRRVNPSDARYMARIASPNSTAALQVAAGAHHYRIIGLELTTATGVATNNIVVLGSGSETSISQLPYALELDRLFVHGDRVLGGKRGISLNSRDTTISNSWISDFKSTWQDTQAIGGWNGAGPFRIINNYLEASGENIMFGGAIPRIPNLVPSDISICRNYLFKPLSWKVGDASFGGIRWSVKNLLELKNARRVTIDGNVLENNWVQAQAGMAVQLTVRTQSGAMPWAAVEDVTLTNNIIRNVAGGLNISGKDGQYGGRARNITIANNIFENVNGRFLQLLNAAVNVTVDHNTILHSSLLISFDGVSSPGLVYRNNISSRGTYGIFGSGRQEGNATLAYYSPGSVVTNNVIGGAPATLYPAANYFPNSVYDAQFIQSFTSNYGLAPSSPYRALGTDGKDLGADVSAVQAATAAVAVVAQ